MTKRLPKGLRDRGIPSPTRANAILSPEEEIQSHSHDKRAIKADGVKKAREDRIGFLTATQSEAAPLDLYAAWLAAWIAQGGEIATHRENDLWQPNTILGYSSPRVLWVPHRSFTEIPSGEHDTGLDLLLVSKLIDMEPSPAPDDLGLGLGTGNNTVLKLDVIGRGKDTLLYSSTDRPDAVESFTDVDKRLADQPMLHRVGRSALSITFKYADLEFGRQ